MCNFVVFPHNSANDLIVLVCGLLSGNWMTDSNSIRWICIAMLVSHSFIFQHLIKRQWVYHLASELSFLLRKRQRSRWRRKTYTFIYNRHFYNEQRHIVEIDKFDCWSDYNVHYHLRSQYKRTPHTRFTPCVDLFACWDYVGSAIGWQRCRDRESCYRYFHCVAFNTLLIWYFRAVRQRIMSSSMSSYTWLSLCKRVKRFAAKIVTFFSFYENIPFFCTKLHWRNLYKRAFTRLIVLVHWQRDLI